MTTIEQSDVGDLTIYDSAVLADAVVIRQGMVPVVIKAESIPALIKELRTHSPKPRKDPSALDVFNLSPGMVAKLVEIHATAEKGEGRPVSRRWHVEAQKGTKWAGSINSHFIVAMRGLVTRGLLDDVQKTRREITPLGLMVVELLKESGVYDEIVATLTWKELC